MKIVNIKTPLKMFVLCATTNAPVQVVNIVAFIREAPSSNIGQDTIYPYGGFSGLPQSALVNYHIAY
jgi:hypothetical protein